MFLIFLLLQHDHDHGAHEHAKVEGEIRVYLSDREQRPLDLATVTATIEILVPGAAPRSVVLEWVPKGKRTTHEGEVREFGPWRVELAVGAPCDCCGGGETPATYFKAPFPLEIWWCGGGGHPFEDKSGTCPMCKADLKPRPLEFSAKLTLKIGEEVHEVRGFEYPWLPRTYADGVARIEQHLGEIKARLREGRLEAIPALAARVTRVAEWIPRLIPKDELPEVLKASLEMVGLGKVIEDAARKPDAAEAGRAHAKYLERLEILKKHVKR